MAEFFEPLSRAEAQAVLARYLSYHDARLEYLRSEYRAGGGDPDQDLDFTPESLVRLWRWAADKLQLRGLIYPPPWLNEYAKLIVTSFDDWMPKTPQAVLIDAIAFYFADVCIRHLEGVKWEVCELYCGSFNQPVLGGFKYEPYQPRELVQMAAFKAAERKGGDDHILESFHILSRNVGEMLDKEAFTKARLNPDKRKKNDQ